MNTSEDTQDLHRDAALRRVSLIDPTTRLPVLAARLETLCRSLDRGQRLGLVYFDLSEEARLEAVYGWEVYENVLREVALTIDEIRRHELGEGTDLALYGLHSDEFLLFLNLSPRQDFRPYLEQVRDRILSELSARLTIQVSDEEPRTVDLHTGVDLIHTEPMVRRERSLYQTIDTLRAQCRRRRETENTARLRELKRIVRSGDIQVWYQPIIELRKGRVVGFEALTRVPSGGVFETTEMLFAFAEESDHILELERLCRMASIRGASQLESEYKLFLNCSAPGFVDPELFCRSLVEAVERAGLAPKDVVLEITERVAITAWQEFRRSVAALRLIGFSIALDDMGAGYSSLKSVADVQPDYLKVDHSLVRDVHASAVKRDLLESLVGIAKKIGAQVIAEGVEKEAELQALRALDVPFAQGYLFARPDAQLRREGFELPPLAPAARGQ